MRFPRLLAAAALFGIFPCGVAAQTTPTEREAARDVVRQIDELQTRIAPTEMAQRLLAGGGADRDRVLRRAEQLWTSEFRALSDHIGRNPEVGWKEFKAVDTLTKVLRAKGFKVETGQAGFATAFVGTWDSPAGTQGPTLGVIVEYDDSPTPTIALTKQRTIATPESASVN